MLYVRYTEQYNLYWYVICSTRRISMDIGGGACTDCKKERKTTHHLWSYFKNSSREYRQYREYSYHIYTDTALIVLV